MLAALRGERDPAILRQDAALGASPDAFFDLVFTLVHAGAFGKCAAFLE
jgi:hypothetical protein